jgi:hypothetical protein
VQVSAAQCSVEDVFRIMKHRSVSETDAAWAARPNDFDAVSWPEARAAAIAARRASLAPSATDDAAPAPPSVVAAPSSAPATPEGTAEGISAAGVSPAAEVS